MILRWDEKIIVSYLVDIRDKTDIREAFML